nr:class I SAM-dependent methyltransferase [uncultured Lichenicoccus sp.]
MNDSNVGDLASLSRDRFEATLAALGDRVPDALEYDSIAKLTLEHRLVPRLLALDPFSSAYRDVALEIYYDLRRSGQQYVPDRDEQSGIVMPDNLSTGVSPWNFRHANFVAEFLLSWGHIMQGLDLPPNSDAKILEYGTGSGQLLLFLARLGLQVSAVDIDGASLQLVRAQADAARVSVRTEQAAFGEGFPGEQFDRFIFFEAFHHALDFVPLLTLLRRRLNPGGKLVLCGEPVVGEPIPAVPYPWGPRLDGLSVFCIRRYGWMELGFTATFLIEAFLRTGWLVTVNSLPNCWRATTYVATPYVGETIELASWAVPGAYAAGWNDAEAVFRWTRGGEIATFPLPDQSGPSRATVVLSNMFPFAINVQFFDGTRLAGQSRLIANQQRATVDLEGCTQSSLGVSAAPHRPSDVWPGSLDERVLGVAVHSIRIDEPQATATARSG